MKNLLTFFFTFLFFTISTASASTVVTVKKSSRINCKVEFVHDGEYSIVKGDTEYVNFLIHHSKKINVNSFNMEEHESRKIITSEWVRPGDYFFEILVGANRNKMEGPSEPIFFKIERGQTRDTVTVDLKNFMPARCTRRGNIYSIGTFKEARKRIQQTFKKIPSDKISRSAGKKARYLWEKTQNGAGHFKEGWNSHNNKE